MIDKELADEQVEDQGVEQAEIPQEREEAPKDVRGAIRAAFKEHSEDGDVKDTETDRPKRSRARDETGKFAENTDKRPVSDKANKASDEREPVQKENKEGETEQTPTKESKEPKQVDAPPYYRIKGKAAWDKLDPESRQLLVAREQEISNGFAQVSQRLKNAEDMERAIAPRLEAIQRFGVTPAQTVDRLFQWMEALSGPNKLHSFNELAKSFGVDIRQLTSPQSNTQQVQEQRNDDPPPWFAEFTSKVDQELGGLKNQFRSQQEEAAFTFVKNWSKDKPFYQKVGPLMQQLIAAGVIGTTQDGIVDLDSAYDKACKLDPEVSALIQQESTQRAIQQTNEKLAKEARDREARLAKARKAGSGLKPSPQSTPAPQSKPNGASRSSIRDGIRAAIDELRE